jgi:protein involved in sex pheromone biosynthesis
MSERLRSREDGTYSRGKVGKRSDLGGQYFRSAWEANVARWLNLQNIRWEYEPKTFEFTKIRKGSRFYTPDFYLPDEGRFIEVKGWMDPKSATKLKRMAKYYPAVSIEVIGPERYRGIKSACSTAIPGWE